MGFDPSKSGDQHLGSRRFPGFPLVQNGVDSTIREFLHKLNGCLSIGTLKVSLVSSQIATGHNRLHLAEIFYGFPHAVRLSAGQNAVAHHLVRSEEHTSELQSLMRISYAVFCLKKKTLTKSTQSRVITY